MDVSALLGQSDVADDVACAVRELVELKSATRELGSAPVPATLREFVDDELALADYAAARVARDESDRVLAWARAESAFIELVRG